jgi:hypothetical protein
MFGVLGSLVKATVAIVDIPVAVASDIVTLGGALTEKDKSYTTDAAERLVQNIKDAASPSAEEK